ncbi:MAG TPA: hypothetical protein DEP35_22000 [Deltaproteobacteria bacterium]|nr:hypothetical protein [Deltaproteobacteria bacterium]
MMHQIGRHLTGHECFYTPFYTDGLLHFLSRRGLLDFTILGGEMRRMTDAYLRDEGLPLDERGRRGGYDLVVSGTDLLIQRNVRGRPLVLVQEGMTDPEGLAYRLVRALRLPRWLASTATTGLSLAYSKFCVASEGYRDLFAAKGVPAERMVVTGIPNFDNCRAFMRNDFPHHGYVLVATSDTRETFKRDRRRRFFARVEQIARGRPLVFKLHPNENVERSSAEIRAWFPEALVFAAGNTNHMIANCDVLITQYSSVVYVGLALGKECHSYFDVARLRSLLPLQNGGRSSRNIARVCEGVLARPPRRAPVAAVS